MKYRYIKNLRDNRCVPCDDMSKVKLSEKPKFKSKALYREWCAKKTTDHSFYSLAEGYVGRARIEGENKVDKIHGVTADFDAPVDWANVDDIIGAKCAKCMPSWRSRTYSGYIRLTFEFEKSISITPALYKPFLAELKTAIGYNKVLAGFDTKSDNPSQYFEIGVDWVDLGGRVPTEIVHTCLFKAAKKHPPESKDTAIPIEKIAEEVDKRFPNRWVGEFEEGSRGPLFWLDDGIEREGCQVFEDGMLVYSDRDNTWMTWRDIFGASFVEEYEQQKMGALLDEYWFNGKQFYKLLHEAAQPIPRDQLVLELRQRGFRFKPRKGEPISEVENAVLVISNQNRINEIAPVIFRRNERVVEFNGARILNSSNIKPIEPSGDGDPKNWPFLNAFFDQFFEDSTPIRSKYYFFAWFQRFYLAVLNNQEDQGQACILVGPAKRGKTLLSNKIIAAAVGGYADASDYLSGGSKFNKELGRAAAWVIDDTVSAASFQDQRKATELIKRGVANPRISFMAKHVDAITIPWSGRIIVSLNDDANSMGVIPTMDSSNRDKLMAFKISKQYFKFPVKKELEKTIDEELPHFLAWLSEWKPPEEVLDDDRFGVKSFIDTSIAYAAYDNSSRSQVAELVDFFAKACRDQNEKMNEWRGTVTQFQVAIHAYNNGRSLGASNRIDFVRNGLSHLEDAGEANKEMRPIKSIGKGSGKVWIINVTSPFDIDDGTSKENAPDAVPI
mgnify:CR=1 FL=1|jgi:hypothetical protein|tara:strand:- start:7875 stop:10055 length:2181 start_codon:yes stop_codon:yes gene_type:complete